MRVREEDVSFRDVKIKIPDLTRRCEWRNAPEVRAQDFGDFEKGQLVGFLARKKKVDFRLLAEARPVALWRVPHVLGADGKARIEKMCISLLMSKNLLTQR